MPFALAGDGRTLSLVRHTHHQLSAAEPQRQCCVHCNLLGLLERKRVNCCNPYCRGITTLVKKYVLDAGGVDIAPLVRQHREIHNT